MYNVSAICRLLFFSLIIGFCNITQGMEITAAIERKDWVVVREILENANTQQKKDTCLKTLLNTNIDLNENGATGHSEGMFLLHELGRFSYQKPCTDEYLNNRRLYFALVLKELIKHDKLNPDEMWSKTLIASLVDGLNTSKPFSTFLQQLCDQICDEKRKSQPWHFTTIFHDYESLPSPNGFTRCKLTWKPLCLLADYRVWASVGALVIAHTCYLLTRRSSQLPQTADEEQEEQKPTSVDNQERKTAQ